MRQSRSSAKVSKPSDITPQSDTKLVADVRRTMRICRHMALVVRQHPAHSKVSDLHRSDIRLWSWAQRCTHACRAAGTGDARMQCHAAAGIGVCADQPPKACPWRAVCFAQSTDYFQIVC